MVIDKELLQTRVPKRALDEAKKLAKRDGITVAAWLRRLVLRETGVSGDGTLARKQ